MRFQYFAEIVQDTEGGFLVTFPDVPEAITHGNDWRDALANASEALGLALRGIVEEGRAVPKPTATTGVPVATDLED